MTKPNSAVLHKKLKDLTPDSRNANKGTPRGNQMIEDSLRQYGAGRSILLDKHGRIIAGNKTAENAGSIGLDDVIVVQTDGTKLVAVQRTDLDLNDPRARQLAIADNRASEVSLDWDVEALKGLALDGVDLAPFFTADELESFWPQNPLQGDEDEVPPVPVEPKSKLGDLYLLGNHRLLCGDSTKREDVERLMAGEKADMVFTDPPYGISIVQGNKVGGGGAFGGKKNEINGAKRIEVHEFAPVIGDESADTAADAYNLCAALEIPVLIFWGGNHYADRLPSSSCWIVWDKENTGNFADAELAWTNQDTAVRIFKHMWNGMVKASERGESRVHPTQKPVALAEWCFEKYGKAKDAVLDLFGGSGSTLIACEKTGRKCFMMELDPIYCDVICLRYYNATGKIPLREDGKPWKSENDAAGTENHRHSKSANGVA
jgi:DNA modification methylase